MTGVTYAHRLFAQLMSATAPGSYAVHVRRREGDRLEKYSTQRIRIERHGSTVVRGHVGSVLELLSEAMVALDGGYLMLTQYADEEWTTEPVSVMWRVLAGHLLPLDGEEAWQVSAHCPEGQGAQWLHADTRFEDAWSIEAP